MNQKHSTCLGVSMLLSALIGPAGEASVSEKFDFTITIHVYNYAAVSGENCGKSKGRSRANLQMCGSDSALGGPPVEDAVIKDVREFQVSLGTAPISF